MLKKILIVLVIIALALAAAYGLYVLYHIVMNDVQVRLKEAIAEGIHEGLSSVVNPISWAKQLVRG